MDFRGIAVALYKMAAIQIPPDIAGNIIRRSNINYTPEFLQYRKFIYTTNLPQVAKDVLIRQYALETVSCECFTKIGIEATSNDIKVLNTNIMQVERNRSLDPQIRDPTPTIGEIEEVYKVERSQYGICQYNKIPEI